MEEIKDRLKAFGEELFGDKHGSAKKFADALGISPQSLSQYLSGYRIPGNKIQEKLRELGCDIDFLMTGKPKEEKTKKHNTLISYSGTPTPEMKKRIERLAEWMANASEEDGKMLEQVARKILKGDA